MPAGRRPVQNRPRRGPGRYAADRDLGGRRIGPQRRYARWGPVLPLADFGGRPLDRMAARLRFTTFRTLQNRGKRDGCPQKSPDHHSPNNLG